VPAGLQLALALLGGEEHLEGEVGRRRGVAQTRERLVERRVPLDLRGAASAERAVLAGGEPLGAAERAIGEALETRVVEVERA
jgi:hypothetical protein